MDVKDASIHCWECMRTVQMDVPQKRLIYNIQQALFISPSSIRRQPCLHINNLINFFANGGEGGNSN